MAHASGAVIVEFLKYGGYPEMQWQRSARNVCATRFKQVLAYSCHIYRSVAHKPVAELLIAAQIAMLGLLSLCCTLPAIQRCVFATMCVTLLGANYMFIDRFVEYLNNLQGQYMHSAHAASFGASVDVTTLLPARSCMCGMLLRRMRLAFRMGVSQ